MTDGGNAIVITYCGAWGYRQRAVRLAAELEGKLGLTSELIQGSGGIFEVQYQGANVFSKKAVNRFPEDGEVPVIIHLLGQGVDLKEAQAQASQGIAQGPSFMEWFSKFFKGR